MSDSKPTTQKAEQLANQLKSSLAQRRPRPWKLVSAALLVSVLLLVALVWWLSPKTKLAPLQTLALDVLYTTDETPLARSRLLLTDAEAPRRLGGQRIVFEEHRLIPVAGQKPREIVVTSDDEGKASAEWPVPNGGIGEFLVLHIDSDQRSPSVRDRGRIFVWPKETPLLLVDAGETLIAEKLDANAATALSKAHDAGWRIVYLAVGSDQPSEFRKARSWIEYHAKLPRGPVLGRQRYSGEEATEPSRAEAIRALRDRFTGPMAAVVKSPEAATTSKEAGLRTILLGGGVAPAEVPNAPTWDDVFAMLK